MKPANPANTPYRSPLGHGLALTLGALPAVLWTYLFSLVLALLFSVRLHAQLSALLSHSLAAQSLTSSFDVPTVLGAFLRLGQNVPGGNPPNTAGVLLFALIHFLLVPGALVSYRSGTPARLGTLLSTGLAFFWRFVRITLLTAVAFAVILGPLSALNSALGTAIDDHVVGRPAFLLKLIGIVALFLVATLVRLYLDLVEVYTVQLGQHILPDGRTNPKPDRRVRLTLRPAWRLLTHHLATAWLPFLLLTLVSLIALFLTTRFTVVSLAQPRVWPAFLLGQLGILIALFTRFWQRAAETTLAASHSLRPVATPSSAYVPRPVTPTSYPHTEPPPAPVS